jgi:hypothetical protein
MAGWLSDQKSVVHCSVEKVITNNSVLFFSLFSWAKRSKNFISQWRACIRDVSSIAGRTHFRVHEIISIQYKISIQVKLNLSNQIQCFHPFTVPLYTSAFEFAIIFLILLGTGFV